MHSIPRALFLRLPSVRIRITIFFAATLCALCALARGQSVLVPANVSPLTSGLYTYSYTVTNNSPNEIAIVTFGVLPDGPNTAMNLIAPAGFQITYDSGNGLVSFLEGSGNNSGTFAPMTSVTGFSFTSIYAPSTTSFEALDILGNSYTGATQAPVPEPRAISLGLLGLLALAFALHRRRQTTRYASLA